MNINFFLKEKFTEKYLTFSFQQSESEILRHVYKQGKLNFRKSHDFQ